MGAQSSKAARRLPKTVATSAHPSPALPRPPPEAFAPPPQQAESSTPPAATFDYGRTAPAPGQRGQQPQFSGEKDDRILADGMDPQFLAKLQQLGPVEVKGAGRVMRAPVRAQRTLQARKDEYTDPSATPPPGTITAPMLAALLDTLKSLPAGTDAAPYYAQYNITPDELANVRRWVNSPSVAEEVLVRRDDEKRQRMEQLVEMKGVWIDAVDKQAPKRA